MVSESTSRRRFIAAAASLATVGILAACSPTSAPPRPASSSSSSTSTTGSAKTSSTPAAKSTAAPAAQSAGSSGEITVHYITELWNWQKLGMATATSTYNQQNRGKVQIQVDPSPTGWQTKVVEMVRSGNVLWDGMLRVESLEGYPYYKYGIMQPIAPFIKSSTVKWAAQFDKELLPNIKDLFSIENQLYYLPWDSEVYVRLYMVDQWAKLGGKPAETLADYQKQLVEYQKLYPGSTPLTVPQDASNPLANYQLFGQIWSTDLWTSSQNTYLPNLQGEGFKQYLDLLKTWYAQKIITTDTLTSTTWQDLWLKQKIGSAITDAAWGFTQARQIYGLNGVEAVPVPVLKAGDTPKTFVFSNAASLFKGAKHPQEVVDWLLWMIDPTNTKPGPGTFMYSDLNYYHFPVYNTPYEKIVATNPLWKWVGPMLPMVQASKPIPPATYASMWRDIMVPAEDKYAQGQATLSETIQTIDTQGKAQMAKLAKP